MTVSVCTLAHGRAAHLTNLVRGLEGQSAKPDELIIAVMQPEAYRLPDVSFSIRQLIMGQDGIPLAAARNAAARGATGSELVFLDVDCIPEPSLVADYARLLTAHDALLMGEILYLPDGATANGIDMARFARIGVKHRDRAGPPEHEIGACADYRCFWSLNFAIRRATFDALGGFDEAFTGYGGEDTDFGRMAVEAGIDLYWCRGARAYHQYHSHHMPPVHHVDSVLANTSIFREKWGHDTMEHWLKAFTLMGLIGYVDGDYRRVRDVDAADLALTQIRPGEAYASSARVLELLATRAPSMAAA